MTVPYTFGTATNPIPLANLDSNFAALGNTTNITYTAPFTNAVAETVTDKLAQTVSVKDFGAVGDGTTDDTTAIQNAFNAVNSNGVIYLPAGFNYSVGSVNVNGKKITFSGYGATITCTGTNGAFYKTDHDNKLSVFGISFVGTGTGKAVNCSAVASGTVYDELLVQDCSFAMGSGIYGLYCIGTREPRIISNTFYDSNSGNGIYFKDCVSPFVDKCIFKGTSYASTAIYYPGTGNATDAGLDLTNSEILGWNVGLEVIGNDWLNIQGCTIDYCNNSIILENQDGGQISNNYIGSLNNNPALWIKSNTASYTPELTDKVIIQNNTFTGHYSTDSTYDNILINGTTNANNLQILNNNFTFYTRYGINLSMLDTKILIQNNYFSEYTGLGVSPIYSQLGTNDSGVSVIRNNFANTTTVAAMNLSAISIINYNIGCVTENRNEYIFGATATPITIAHGCSYTPAISDVSINPNSADLATRNPYVSSTDATNIYITITSSTTLTTGVSWRVHRGS